MREDTPPPPQLPLQPTVLQIRRLPGGPEGSLELHEPLGEDAPAAVQLPLEPAGLGPPGDDDQVALAEVQLLVELRVEAHEGPGLAQGVRRELRGLGLSRALRQLPGATRQGQLRHAGRGEEAADAPGVAAALPVLSEVRGPAGLSDHHIAYGGGEQRGHTQRSDTVMRIMGRVARLGRAEIIGADKESLSRLGAGDGDLFHEGAGKLPCRQDRERRTRWDDYREHHEKHLLNDNKSLGCIVKAEIKTAKVPHEVSSSHSEC
ncbi:hypothetical protein EYF80_022035 [Liparis tanakae]|uniref:Uncharacterized protein n=1 Tax=Liparis tanakae TaxID=230148 RepID=A0A4Z2HPE2_9TELE|nr:hypothetical protein EYF80_022035 [Liparis tanakae]